jgi:hypothetical protein
VKLFLHSHKYAFYLIVFLIPLNLGKHFIFNWSYSSGILIDYLIPTVFVTDLLILLLLIWWVVGLKRSDGERLLSLLNDWGIRFLALFFFAVFLSVLGAQSFPPSFYAFLKMLLYAGLFLYVIDNFDLKKDFTRMVQITAVSVFLLGILAGLQWSRQGSVFNNYLFFGEQPYSFSTYNVVRKDFFGETRVPAYGLFRHPNTFGGFLAITLIWMLVLIPEKRFVIMAFVPGALALFFTLSLTAWTAFVFALFCVFTFRFFRDKGKYAALALTSVFVITSLLLPLFPEIKGVSEHPSFFRRSGLLSSGEAVIRQNFLFGVGLNNNTVISDELHFIQPIHNVFVLVFAESGVFAFVFFVLFMLFALKKAFPYPLLLITLIQILLLMSFDHYFYTINQTQILFWLTLGMVFKYNLR